MSAAATDRLRVTAIEAVMEIGELGRQLVAEDALEREDLLRGAVVVGLARSELGARNFPAVERYLSELDGIFERRLDRDVPENRHHIAIRQHGREAASALDRKNATAPAMAR